jgi:formylglycine-generating enzyme
MPFLVLLQSALWLACCAGRSSLEDSELVPSSFGAAGNAAGTTSSGGAAATTPPSCLGLATTCQTGSCCTSIKVPGGTLLMGRSETPGETDYYSDGDSDEIPEHRTTIADFVLDKYEVTVGRFRAFVGSYDTWHQPSAFNPRLGVGVNPNVDASNRGLTGWGKSWPPSADDLPADAAALVAGISCDPNYQTWKDTADTNEAYPINCVTWFEAFAFCVWDGGRLPTEAEWEYAAAGGMRNRLYPWGSATPDDSRANFNGSDVSPFVVVGSKGSPGSTGAFGHQDLAGSMWEWVFDWYSDRYYGTTEHAAVCNNCANTATNPYRSVRGGSWYSSPNNLRGAFRNNNDARNRDLVIGIRCARDP